MKAYVILVLLFLVTEVSADRPIIPGLSELGTDLNITWDGDVMTINNIKIETINLLFSTIRKYYPYAEITMDFDDDAMFKELIVDIGGASKRGDYKEAVESFLTYLQTKTKHKDVTNKLYREIESALQEANKKASDKPELKDTFLKALTKELKGGEGTKAPVLPAYEYAKGFLDKL